MRNTMKETWASGGITLGAWASIPSTLVAEIASRSGLDYVCLDEQHGLIDHSVAAAMLQAIELGPAASLVRVKTNSFPSIGVMLDSGADGVIVPMVNSAVEAQQAVAACRYAPEGSRSFGPIRRIVSTPGFTPEASNAAIACIPMVETAAALADIEGILATPGVDAVYMGPADLSLTLGLPPRNNDGEPAFDEAIELIVRSCQNAGVVPGCHTTTDLVERRLEQGFRMITCVADQSLMKQGFADVAERFGLDGRKHSRSDTY